MPQPSAIYNKLQDVKEETDFLGMGPTCQVFLMLCIQKINLGLPFGFSVKNFLIKIQVQIVNASIKMVSGSTASQTTVTVWELDGPQEVLWLYPST